ncbi:hypothetical protein M2093_001572 [Breznakia sp. PH1-1]|nr:hypothetical protein [Breznakia sp. PH1-1]MDH6403949.1 hypothetical protein [Breznakia sp. PF1-11]MDH6411658.1 hypothetical protein [Breznakia sp. PFB1-11]MDH6414584.1 hypothetical protein [Breznakia sp. PFB1-14]MDH6416009.1 hypothetical protein [Breznakia sp. PFB1-4]MDH6418690.1 hypothetical protein [Breznakia sp. PFB1-12]MDH6473500.1 hypothetical protein [Breznakia sp. PFB2-30]MDH6475936.1 hypothetical protein [Breznakia sp. PFB1-19]
MRLHVTSFFVILPKNILGEIMNQTFIQFLRIFLVGFLVSMGLNVGLLLFTDVSNAYAHICVFGLLWLVVVFGVKVYCNLSKVDYLHVIAFAGAVCIFFVRGDIQVVTDLPVGNLVALLCVLVVALCYKRNFEIFTN